MSATSILDRLHLPILILAASFPLDVSSQRVEPMTLSRVRALTKDAQSEAHGDKNDIVLGLDARVRARWGDFESFPISIVRREDLTIVLSTPYMTYRRTLADYLRLDRPIGDTPWVPAAVITVAPERLDAPDITRVVLERGGKTVTPVENLLRLMTFTNGGRDQALIHGGEVRFPMSAFAPGASVTISAIPQAGSDFVMTLDEAQLRTLK